MGTEAIEGIGSDYASREATRVQTPTYEPGAYQINIPDQSQTLTTTAVREKSEAGGDQNQQEDPGKEERERKASEASIKDATSRANRSMEQTRCEYSYHKETNRVSIKVIDKNTDKVIREIPPEKSLDMLQKMWEMAGILVDEKR